MAEALKAKILGALGLGAKPQGAWALDKRITVTCTVVVPKGTPANASNNISFTIDPKVGSVVQYTIPKGFRFTLVDMYIKSSADVGADGIAKLKKDFFEDYVITPPLSTMLVSNPSRPQVTSKTWDEGSTLSGEYINTVPAGDTDKTVTFYLIFDVYKKVGA